MSDYKIRQQSVDGSGIEGQTTLDGDVVRECEECGGQLLDDGTETVCDDCGLVADEDAGVSDYTVRRHWQRIQEAGIDGGQVDV